jgi:hypothetical protein
MFKFLKNRRAATSAAEIERQFKDAEHDIGAKWVDFLAKVHFNSEVTLSERIDSFAVPVFNWVTAKYPLVAIGPAGAGACWLLIFTAIRDSRTHSPDVLNAAIAELKSKYASRNQP